MLFSIVVPLSGENINQDMLCVNIDIGKLYIDILERNSNISDLSLIVYNADQEIVISDDFRQLYTEIEEIESLSDSLLSFPLFHKEGMITATTWSKDLNWHFQIQLPYVIRANIVKNTYFIVTFLLFMVMIMLIGSYAMIGMVTKPIRVMLTDYHDKLLREILLNTSTHEKVGEMKELVHMLPYHTYRILLIELAGNKDDLSVEMIDQMIRQLEHKEKFMLQPVFIDRSKIAIVCNYDQVAMTEKGLDQWIQSFYAKLNHFFMGKVYIASSNPKKNLEGLSVAYRECEEIQSCKLSLDSHIFTQERFQSLQVNIVYPVELEKQLINNLMVGNVESCIYYTNKFFAHLFENEGLLPDIIVKNYLFQLQNEILKRISSLPVSIKFSNSVDMLNEAYTREELQNIFLELVQSLCNEIEKKDVHNKNMLHEAIIEYINAHLTESDFNLNSLSYQFNLNRNYLAKLIKEKTTMTFNDYINQKKIEISKELLNSTDLTIDDIAHKTGFNYTHYFIKTFKTLEGITPGQYRKIKE